jgi:hypothetical protein
MNRSKSILTAAAVFLAAFPVSHSLAANPDFSELAGTYRATYGLTSGTTTLPGNVTVTIKVPENGSKANIQIVGFANAGGSGVINLLGYLKLTSRHRITADNALLAFYVQAPATPTRFSGSKKQFRFTLTTATPPFSNTTMSYTLKFNGKRLSIVGSGTLNGNPTSVAINGRKRR